MDTTKVTRQSDKIDPLMYNGVMGIQLLTPDVAAKIAAGEVVERPANVAKELIENSLDAGATEVKVELREGGQRLLRISDNGHGMTAADAPLAFLRHATSKLATVDDLNRIATFGFRGEALYSIAAVSQVTVTTRHQSEPFGTQLRVAGGEPSNPQRAGAPVGTIVTVEHLFYNMPARQKFLRRASTETGRIADLIQRFALTHPHCRFTLITDGRPVFQSTGAGNLLDVLTKIYGLEQTRQLVAIGSQVDERRLAAADSETTAAQFDEVDFMAAPAAGSAVASGAGGQTTSSAGRQQDTALNAVVHVRGYASLPSLTRPNRSEIHLFVNQRQVEDRNLTYAIIQAYHTLLPVGRYPVAVVKVDLDPTQVDVNVHPQKSQVRFVEERMVFGAVQKAVRQAIMAHAPPPTLVLPAPLPESRWQPSGNAADQPATVATAWNAGPAPTLFDQQAPPQHATPAESAPDHAPEPASDMNAPAESGPTPLLSERKSQLPPLRVVGQVGAMYIITEGPEGMYLIDQHAAHERILYEKFMAQRAQDRVARQQLLQPLTLHVGTGLAGQVAQHLDELRSVGFEIENFGHDTFLVRAVPAVLAGQDPLRALEEMASTLAEQRNLAGEEHEARLVKMICKRASIKGGQLLSDLEMQELVRQLEGCQSPRTCPHGRPTMIQLSATELEKAFGRI